MSWLLGTQFHLGSSPAPEGSPSSAAGRESSVCEQGIAWLDELLDVPPGFAAEIVIAGIGRPGVPTSLESLAAGLTTAKRLVQHGGKIVVLSHAAGPLARRSDA